MTRKLALTLVVLTVGAASALGQSDYDRARIKAERAAEISRLPDMAALVLDPSDSEDALGIHVVQGGVYEPSAFPTESWFEIACIRDDLTVEYDRDKHGFYLVRVHAALYDGDGDEVYNTAETDDIDEGLCSVDSTIDTTWIEIPRGTEVASVILRFAPRSTQQIEASAITYHVLPR